MKKFKDFIMGPVIFLIVSLAILVVFGYGVFKYEEKIVKIPVYTLGDTITEAQNNVVTNTESTTNTNESPQYILTLRVSYEEYTYNSGVHGGTANFIDETPSATLNDLAFSIPVDKEYFDSVELGEILIDTYKSSTGTQWVVWVYNKEIKGA